VRIARVAAVQAHAPAGEDAAQPHVLKNRQRRFKMASRQSFPSRTIRQQQADQPPFYPLFCRLQATRSSRPSRPPAANGASTA